jgi:hypothetical protein
MNKRSSKDRTEWLQNRTQEPTDMIKNWQEKSGFPLLTWARTTKAPTKQAHHSFLHPLTHQKKDGADTPQINITQVWWLVTMWPSRDSLLWLQPECPHRRRWWPTAPAAPHRRCRHVSMWRVGEPQTRERREWERPAVVDGRRRAAVSSSNSW